jgi:tripartite-type tricarboxylate transporter receptor subunit TctC
MFRTFLTILLVLAGSAVPGLAQEKWPSHPVTIIVPYRAGSAPDTIARSLGDELSKRIGQPLVIDNRTGAGGLIGTEAAAAAKNDGYTLFMGSLDTQTIVPFLYKTKRDLKTAFAPISLLGHIYNVIAVSPALKVSTFKELIDAGKAGKTLTFATPGVGTNLHLLGELIKLNTGAKLSHVPYRAASQGYTDAMAGRIDVVIAGIPPLLGIMREKKLVPLAITAPKRIDALPDTPSLSEIGLANLTITGWFGLLAPAGTNPEIIDKLSKDVAAITQMEAYRKKMQGLLIDPVSTTPQEFSALIKSESARMAEIIKKADISVKKN